MKTKEEIQKRIKKVMEDQIAIGDRPMKENDFDALAQSMKDSYECLKEIAALSWVLEGELM